MNLDDRVLKAKEDKRLMDELIKDYQPLIASELSRISNKHIDIDADDLMNVGMMAFFEAVNAYDETRGHFLTLVKINIKNRAIDYFRKINPSTSLCLSENIEMDEPTEALDKYYKELEQQARVIAIREFEEELKKWGMSIEQLVKASPKNAKIRKLYKTISRYIKENENLYKDVINRQQIPNSHIMAHFGISEKKVKRGRQYIIACLILLDETYSSINDYVK